MKIVIQELKNNDNEIPCYLRQELIGKVYSKVAKHYISLLAAAEGEDIYTMIMAKKTASLLEGENPYQVPAHLFQADNCDKLSLANFKQIKGLAPCFTNMADFDCILQALCLAAGAFDKFYGKVPNIAVAAKHGNPCGLSVNWDSQEIAVENALLGNPVAVFGGEVITNFAVTLDLAKILIASHKRNRLLGNPKWSLDLIVAPSFTEEAIEALGKSKRLKLFGNENLFRPYLGVDSWSYRMVRGGFLRQPPANYILEFDKKDAGFPLTDLNVIDSLIIAWAAAFSSFNGGNEVAISKDRMLLGAGGGPATVDACCIAINRAKKCGHNLKGSSFAADAFFPFIDGPQELIKAGCIWGVVPAGGEAFAQVKNYFKGHSAKVYYLPEEFRGFCRH